jgi:glycoside hydrolase-like protein/putative peptidoglycan binding protein
MPRPAPRTIRATVLGLVVGLLATLSVGSFGAPARAAGNVVTPGDFTGYGFDQCLGPSQSAMDQWLTHSPFLAVGIYISGDSRACRSQPNLTSTWVRTQLRRGWRLLPITLGPQASCQPRFPRYGNDETIVPKPGTNARYGAARQQGRAEAVKTVGTARALGIVAGSTMWYDLEGFDSSLRDCRESALAFLSAWTYKMHALGYVSGVYSSAGSGIAMLDQARVERPRAFNLPDQIWIARWDGRADTSTSYIAEDGWHPHARVKQYQGGHDETWGGVRINIDRNFLDLGRGSWAPAESHCDGVRISHREYPGLRPAAGAYVPDPGQLRTLQCLLTEKGLYAGRINGSFTRATLAAANAWQDAHAFPVRPRWTKRNWMSLLADGPSAVLKLGSAGPDVRRLQRALDAASDHTHLRIDGVFSASTAAALRAWQHAVGIEVTGIAAGPTWQALRAGLR